MSNEQTSMLVFKDQAGEYYLLPQETLEQGRVPAEHKAEVERLISEQHDDVQGYFFALPLRTVLIDDGGIGQAITKLLEEAGSPPR